MLVVHHLNNSRSQRVLWLLEELGAPYEVKRYQRDAKTRQAPKELRDIHPLGKSPVLTEDGKVIAETGAIVEYLLERYGQGRLVPQDADGRLRYRYWLHYAEGSAMTPLLLRLLFARIPENAPGLVRPLIKSVFKTADARIVEPQLKAHIALWEAELSKSEWFAGNEFSAADIMMSFPCEAAAQRAGAKEKPRITAFLDRIHSRPAYQAALKTGGPYNLMS
jgi:glutathione S-transferase